MARLHRRQFVLRLLQASRETVAIDAQLLLSLPRLCRLGLRLSHAQARLVKKALALTVSCLIAEFLISQETLKTAAAEYTNAKLRIPLAGQIQM